MEEGPQPLPDPTGAAVLGRCGRHPAQPLAGVCSSCLAERLSSVRSPEIVEVHTPSRADRDGASGSGADRDQGKLRKTLMLLFQMDDDSGGAARLPEAEDPQPSSRVGPGRGAGQGPKWKGGSWLRSILPKKRAPRWRTPGKEKPPRPSVEEGSVVPDPDTGGGEDATPGADRRASFRRSCEWMVCRDPPPASRSGDPPRHSWDGSMVGRALACSFACLDDEPPDGVTRVRRSNADESSVGVKNAGAAESRNGGHSADNLCGETGPEMSVSGVGRRRSNRWSRVWDRSITSPLKEFVRKGEHALDRSLSESRKDTRRCTNRETTDIDSGEIHSGRNGLSVSGRPNQSNTRSSQAAASNGDAHNFRNGWLKNKECKIGRSRSVHYTSPGNYDNGMLRFYLTPMRSNRSANRGRRRSSRLFTRGLFGFV